MTEEQAWNLFAATGLPEAYLLSRLAAREGRNRKPPDDDKNRPH